MPKEEIDKYLCLGLIPNFALIKSNKIDLEDFCIEKIDWTKVKDCFPDINLNQFIEYKYVENPYFIVFGEITDSPKNRYVGGGTVKKNGKTIIFMDESWEFYDLGLDHFKKVILLLNLFKRSSVPVFTSVGFFRWTTEDAQYRTKHISANIDIAKHIDWDEESVAHHYCLTGDEFSELNSFKKNVSRLLLKENPSKDEKYLQIAMEYFLEGCLKEANDNDEMAALDFIIGLEALYLTDEQELKYKFANRVAILLSNPEREDERKELQEYAEDVYKLRNKIVHGGLSRKDIRKRLTSTTGKQIGEKVYSIRELARLSLLYFLPLHYNWVKKKKEEKLHDEILHKIDSGLFSKDNRIEIMREKRKKEIVEISQKVSPRLKIVR